MMLFILLLSTLYAVVLSKSIILDKDLKVRWNIHDGLATVDILAQISSQDWVGVGFSDYGELTGADLCVFWRDWKGKIYFSDVHISSSGLVQLDTLNHCNNLKWRIKKPINQKRGAGTLEYVYQRKLDTCDPNDYRIEDGTTHVVWAIGRGPLFKLEALNITSSDNVRTGMSRTRFIQVKEEKSADSRPFLVRNQNLSVPDSETAYLCSVFKLPKPFHRKHHVTEYRPYIPEESLPIVHHMEVFHCEGEEEFPIWSGNCADQSAPEELRKCKKVLAAWAIGARPFQYPKEAGLALGGPGFSPYVMLEVHFNNQERLAGLVDDSGIEFLVTQNLRKFDAGIFELGLEYNNKMAIPPGMDKFILTGSCVPECTAVSLPVTGIMIFGSQLHTHGTGVQVQTTLVRDGQETMVNIDRHYSTHFQEIRLLSKPVHVLPGDSLLTSCTYSTLTRQNITLGGFGFQEEMCVNYVHYYPKNDLEVCKSSVDSDDLSNYFDNLKTEEGQDTDSTKSVEENYRAIRWNKKRAVDLDRLYSRGSLSLQCTRGSGEPFQGFWNKISQVKINDRYKPEPSQCEKSSNLHKSNPPEEKLKRISESEEWAEIENPQKHTTPPEERSRAKTTAVKKRMDHIHMHKRFLNKYSNEWGDYDTWGVDKRTDWEISPELEDTKTKPDEDDDSERYSENVEISKDEDEDYNIIEKRINLGSM